MRVSDDNVICVPRLLFEQIVSHLETMLDESAFRRRRELFERAKAIALAGDVIPHHLDEDTRVPFPPPIRAEE